MSEKLDKSTSFTASSTASVGDDIISLPIEKAPLTGRCEEIKVIQAAHERVCGGTAEILLVHSASGIGKSALVNHVFKECTSSYFCTGKCSSRLYGGIVDATTELCFAIHESKNHELIRSKLESSMRQEEIQLFQQVVPAIEFVIPGNKRGSIDTNEQSFNRFMSVYRKFLQQVCSENVLVLCLDDLQWADTVTRQLIDSIARDSKLTNLLFIGSYREDEINFELPLESVLKVTEIQLGPLNVENVNTIVSSIVGRPPDETRELSEIVHRKTAGNVYFVLQYLEMLHREGLLHFNLLTTTWQWDATKVAARTAVSENVVEILVQKIGSISAEAQMVLVVAACLGHRFSVKVLDCVLTHESMRSFLTNSTESEEAAIDQSSMSKDEIHKAIRTAIRVGLIEKVSSTHCKFSHDRVQQSAYFILPSGEQGRLLQSRLGEIILKLSREEGSEEWMLFCAIDLLSKSESPSLSRTEMAQLCLEAARKASRKAAFQSAAGYADNGIKRLGSDWDANYVLWFELADLSCEMHYSSGNLAVSKEMANTIIQKSQCIEDRFRAYKVTMDIFATQEDYPGAVSKGLCLLKDLGIPTPRRKPGLLSVIVHLTKARRRLKGRSARDVEKLPRMENPIMEQALQLLGKTSFCAWHNGDENLCVCLNLIMFAITLEHGIGEDSPYAFSAYGLVLAHLGKWTEAYEFGALAMRTLELPGMKKGIAKVTVVVHAFLNYLKRPIQESVEPFLQGFSSGMEVGDLVQACVCLQNRTFIGIFSGMRLVDHEREGIEFCEFYKEYKQFSPLKHVLPWLQMTENLLGKSDDATKLTGTFMDEQQFHEMYSELSRRNQRPEFWWLLFNIYYARMTLFCTLGEFEKAEEDRKKFLKMHSGTGTTWLKFFNYFFCGLTCLVMAGKGERVRYYKRQSKFYRKELQARAKSGSVNSVPMILFFEAEVLSLEEAEDRATEKYNQCIAFASRSGFRLIRGIACERAGEYMLKCGKADAASDYLVQAYSVFADMGAVEKQEQLMNKYGDVASFSTTTMAGSHSSSRLRARSVKQWSHEVNSLEFDSQLFVANPR